MFHCSRRFWSFSRSQSNTKRVYICEKSIFQSKISKLSANLLLFHLLFQQFCTIQNAFGYALGTRTLKKNVMGMEMGMGMGIGMKMGTGEGMNIMLHAPIVWQNTQPNRGKHI